METVDFDFKLEQVEEILHRDDAHEWYDAMVEMLPKYQIDTPKRVAGFIAQTAHESASYRTITENLNYSAKALDAIFGKYFKRAGVDASKYHRQPRKIANRIYANRMDNGDTASGDGWTFRGGGILQLTGRYNYTQFGKTVGMSAEEATEYVRTPKGAIESACWFWTANDINKYCDKNWYSNIPQNVLILDFIIRPFSMLFTCYYCVLLLDFFFQKTLL